MTCPYCQTANSDTDGYCCKCGKGLLPETQAAPRYRERATARRTEAIVLAIGMLALALVAYGGWVYLTRTDRPEAVLARFIKADLADDMRGREALVDRAMDRRDFGNAWHEIRRAVGGSPFRNHTIADIESSGYGATTIQVQITVPMPPAPGTPSATVTRTIPIHMTREPEGWRVNASSVTQGLAANLASAGYIQLAAIGMHGPGAPTMVPVAVSTKPPAPPPAAKPKKPHHP